MGTGGETLTPKIGTIREYNEPSLDDWPCQTNALESH